MAVASLMYAAAFIGWLVTGQLQQLGLATHHAFSQNVRMSQLDLAHAILLTQVDRGWDFLARIAAREVVCCCC